MRWLDRIEHVLIELVAASNLPALRQPEYAPHRSRARRSYSAAQLGRLTAGWNVLNLSADSELRSALATLRARSRELAQNNDYAKKFLKLVVANVVGSKGLTLQNRAKDPNGSLDVLANQRIEDSFTAWSRKGTFDVTGTLSRQDGERLFMESIARDGEVLVRLVRKFDNPFRFAVQFLEADHLDETLNMDLDNGNRITMGVERDSWKRPVAYHLLVNHPGDFLPSPAGKTYERVPAEEILHEFLPERVQQARGVPWMHTAMTRLNMLGGYEEAELVAARVAASKMGFFTPPVEGTYTGDAVDEQGNKITDAEPGTFEELPPGTTFTGFEPDHPGGNFGPFMKTTLRGIASGLLVAYESLASDREGVNYSSIRSGMLEERDIWRVLQYWMIEHFSRPIFEAWLDMALLSGALRLPAEKFDKFNAPDFQPRGWAWVDPEKDVAASSRAVWNGLKTRTQILAEEGLDREDVFAELADEEASAKKLGLVFEKPKDGTPPPGGTNGNQGN